MQQSIRLRCTRTSKISILRKLENNSVREGQRELLSIFPSEAKPKEQVKLISADQCELKVVLDNVAKEKLEKVRGLIGHKGANMSYGDLIDAMAEISIAALETKKSGKKRPV